MKKNPNVALRFARARLNERSSVVTVEIHLDRLNFVSPIFAERAAKAVAYRFAALGCENVSETLAVVGRVNVDWETGNVLLATIDFEIADDSVNVDLAFATVDSLLTAIPRLVEVPSDEDRRPIPFSGRLREARS